MGRKKKTLHDYAAEFTELAVKRHLLERGAAGEAAVVETLYCTSCELPMRVRRDRILEHLSSGRHYRNRRLGRQHGLRAPLLLSAGPDLGASLPLQLDPPSLLSQPSFILSANPCITSAGTSTSYSMVPSPPSCPKALIPVPPGAVSSTTSIASAREDQTPSTSTSRSSAFAAFHVRSAPAPSKQTGQRLLVPEVSDSAVPGGAAGRSSSTASSIGIGLALFGVGLVDKALFQSLMEENSCCLLYIVENQLQEVERAFSAEFLANTRVLRQQDADVVLSDQRVSGAIISSPPEEASEIVIDALRADMAYLKDADTVAVSMKFPSGAIVTLDVSQHCTKSCDQRLEVHGSQGTLRVDNQNPLGITEHGTSVSIYSQTHADRFRDAHRELFRHFLRTLKGKEPPAITKEQFLWAIQVAAAAEQSWRNGSAVDLRNEAIDSSVIKTEIM
ncbi:uncharacterized protein [Apteryx mantelli]|uniref:Uncharacterized protein isoform X2 n=1 Tax=Apteryx mantelli TaxID=2696672 RepID=A0ABM4FQ81_9AVES